ncbi:hypothetical protein, conserved [Babesia bigemina]|nr:hypothetical protein, conserved [Babesia bigemina]CDR71592.1 hypothetical protein, conserved [Babesia bigemina]|eukprot:XP_012770538.1 hypothetical protein, conserved [Babesia bigemina]
MGFLSGVLGAVKNENEVTTYDTDKSKDINTVINTLNTNIGSGREGLVESVGAVKAWLEGYDTTLTQKTNNVTKHLDTLSKNIDNNINEFNSISSYNVFQQHDACRLMATKMTANVNESKEALKQLDKNAQKMLTPPLNSIHQAVDAFTKSAENNDLQVLNTTAREELANLKTLLEGEVAARVNEMATNIDNAFEGKIHGPLTSVNSELMKSRKTLEDWIYNAYWILKKAIGNVEKIVKLLNNTSDKREKEKVEKAATKLKDKADKLYNVVIQAKKKLETTVEEALGVVKKMDGELKWELGKVKSGIQNRFNAFQLNLAGIKDLEENVKEGLWNLRGQIKQGLDGNIQSIIVGIKAEIKKIIKGDAELNDSDGLSGVKEKLVKGYADGFNGEEKFADKVMEWITKTLTENAMVKSRIEKYVQDNTDVNGKLMNSYKHRDSSTGNYTALNDKIANIIKANIKQKLTNELFKSDKGFPLANANMKAYVEYVKHICEKFTERLGSVIKEPDISHPTHVVNIIVGEINSTSGQMAGVFEKIPTDNHNIPMVVRYTLTSLQSKANQVAKELQSFALTNGVTRGGSRGGLAGNLDSALSVAEKLDHNLDKNRGHAPGTEANYADKVTSEIERVLTDNIAQNKNGVKFTSEPMKKFDLTQKQLTAIYEKEFDAKTANTLAAELNKQLPDVEGGPDLNGFAGLGDSIKVDLRNAPSFTNYNTYIKPAAANMAKMSGAAGEGKLPEAIKKIQNQVDGIDHLGKITIVDGNDDDKFYKNSFDTLLSTFNTQLSVFITAVKDLVQDGTTPVNILPPAELSKPKNTDSVRHCLRDLEQMIEIKDDAAYTIKSRTDKNDSTISVAGLQKIHKDILKILGGDFAKNPNKHNLAGILVEAEKFHSTVIAARADETIATIKDYLTDACKRAVNNIKRTAQEIYASRKKRELEELKSIVDSQKSEIQNIIDKDIASGIKCLLSIMDGNHEMVAQIPRQNDFNAACNYSRWYLDPFFDYILQQSMTPPLSPTGHVKHNSNSDNVEKLQRKLDTLLTKLRESNHFDRTFTDNLAALKQLLTTFPPSSFYGIFNGALLDGLRAGLDGLCSQLCYAYVNTYDGRTVRELIKNLKHEAGGNKVDAIYDLTDDGRKAAKVCLTALMTVYHDFAHLRDNYLSHAWHRDRINRSKNLGNFFNTRGFIVSDESRQNGELQDKSTMKGTNVIELLKRDGKLFNNINSHIFAGTVTKLHDYLEIYYQVCHMATHSATRQPCSVNDMLIWFCGLPYNNAHITLLGDGISSLLDNPAKALGGEDDVPVFDITATYLNAYPKKVTYANFDTVLDHLCSQSYILLTKIIGTGNAHTLYASDYCNNALNFRYPATGEECLDMLLDILRRLFPPLKYLLTQCSNNASNFGWRDCPYGKDVPTVKWPCNEHSNEKPRDQPKGQPNCKPNCQAKCQVNCQSNSPLMSYLYDCLPGHLPHQLSSIGCKYTCSTCATGKTGMPCLTPLGFRGFSGDPKIGKNLCDVLTKFFEHEHLSSLLSLAPKAPSTLPEHLSFTLSLVKHWNNGGRHLIRDAFTKAITDQSIGLYEQPATLTSALCNVYGNIKGEHRNIGSDGSEASLPFTSLTTSCTTQDHCAPYLRSLCDDTYAYLVSKQAGTYFSWAIYSPWTLWKYVQCLLTDFQNISCKDWGCRGCARGDQCKRGQHGLSDDKNRKSYCQCRSIVGCRGTSPTFYRYGFTYASSEKLIINGTTCSSFFDHLTRVLTSQYMKDLLTECDKFLYYIRAPFIWLNVALWLLSLLYLIHIMVVRLDLLHIKSHLHSPSSHRVAAQSLLAAARVNKLNKVFYLQP